MPGNRKQEAVRSTVGKYTQEILRVRELKRRET